jgi:hypothetical protein
VRSPLVYIAFGIYASATRPILFLDVPVLRARRHSTQSLRAVGRKAMAELRAFDEMDRFILVSRLGGIPDRPQR